MYLHRCKVRMHRYVLNLFENAFVYRYNVNVNRVRLHKGGFVVMETITIGKNKYTLKEFGRLVAYKRSCGKNSLSQTELADKVKEYLSPDRLDQLPPTVNATRVMLGRLEQGTCTKFPTDGVIEALIYALNLEEGAKDDFLTADRVVQIMDELKVIIESIPARSAESLLFIAQMLKNGDLNNKAK